MIGFRYDTRLLKLASIFYFNSNKYCFTRATLHDINGWNYNLDELDDCINYLE